jgi:hypothetical protein
MSTTEESGVDGPLPSSIKLHGFHCYRRGGCDRKLLCGGERKCIGVDPRLVDELHRNRFEEIAEIVRALTYAEMIEFANGLWSLRGEGKVDGETLPKILHAWARKMELASDFAVHDEPVLGAAERDCGSGKQLQPIDSAPRDRPILAFMLGGWRIVRWKPNHPRKQPIPFWSADDLRVNVSRTHQPKWWVELPPLPPDAEA